MKYSKAEILILFIFYSEVDVWHEQVQHEDENRPCYNHKGRNNNNNTQEKMLPLWASHSPAMCDSMRACRWVRS